MATTADTLRIYANLLEEVKARNNVVLTILTDAKERRFAFPPYFLGEFCFLQLRMMCELIALGCLLVHGDIPATRTRRMRDAYSADWIIKRLGELHPSFYPLPGDQRVVDGKVLGITPKLSQFLTKDNLISLYAECGSILHRGSLKGVIAERIREADLVQVSKWTRQIVELLNHHQIPLAGGEHQIWALMSGKLDGHVQVVLMQRFEAEPPV
jgi:hypothetical protein